MIFTPMLGCFSHKIPEINKWMDQNMYDLWSGHCQWAVY